MESKQHPAEHFLNIDLTPEGQERKADGDGHSVLIVPVTPDLDRAPQGGNELGLALSPPPPPMPDPHSVEYIDGRDVQYTRGPLPVLSLGLPAIARGRPLPFRRSQWTRQGW